MKIRGLSYQHGVLFFGASFISRAYIDREGKIHNELLPLSLRSYLKVMTAVASAMPGWYKLAAAAWFTAAAFQLLPFYTFLLFAMGTHFIFPEQLKKFHGAEHKIFSFSGVPRKSSWRRIKLASITNPHCSTNIVFIYFILFLVMASPVYIVSSPGNVFIAVSAYISLPMAFAAEKVLQRHFAGSRKTWLKPSYWLQRNITCSVPEKVHVQTAITAFRTLAEHEFPHRLRRKRKEQLSMAIVDVTVSPIDKQGTGMSDTVAKIQDVLEKHNDKIDIEMTPMSTLLEGNIDDLLQAVREIHEIPFQEGYQRVSTNIRIDDRRDAEGKQMKKKMESVQNARKQ
ncbi:hypothetical protein CHL76_04265 [Marinococcus halophilus]|uniref:MTH1187 family thiamine-binding protein n=1 Tax=Marinococcus halophilus TaxID=1371 RepID=UPI000BA17050|nr:MTH1187 family thiamine-binding protein [Marinococcus halophilus]OZT81002.1 hypothetical protein CHL76_04265 [Marinococcus halophilus]